MTGIGSVLGYLSGYVNLPKLVPLLGNTQFKVLCIIACLALGSTVVISSLYIKERDPRLEGPPAVEKPGVLPFFRQVFLSIKRLPSQIRKVCDAQFFNWIGWFPFLFYISTYVGQIYVNPFLEDNPNMAPEEINALWERATRQGTFSLLIFAITSFTSNMLLPFLVAPSYQAPRLQPRVFVGSPTVRNRPTTPSTPGGMTSTMTSFFPPTPSPKSPSRLTRLLDACQIRWLTLRRAWLLSHILFAFCMFLTFFVRSTAAATAVVGLVGISWAMTLWAPFALISAEVSKRDAARRSRIAGRGNGEEFYARADDESEDQAGIILGLHNVAIAAPQVIATLASSLIFKMIQKPRGETGDDSVGWVLRFGGGAALIAAYMTSRIEEEWDLKKGDGGGGEVGDDVSV
jgi:solute carrier family 45 protein 1/2/4